MKKIRTKTYHNFLIVRNALMREKGYDPETANTLAHNVFAAMCGNPGLYAYDIYRHILSKAEYEAEYGIR